MDNGRLDDFTWTLTDQVSMTRAVRVRTLGQMVLISVLLGALSAALVLPAVLIPAVVTRESARYVAALPTSIEEPPLPQRSVLLDRNGHRFATLFAYDRVPVSTEQMSAAIRTATVDTEDARFYSHHGADPVGIARAFWTNARAGGEVQGASTITQQYVKNVLVLASELGSDAAAAREGAAVSVTRKIREIKLAAGMEKKFTKDEILTKYLNIAFFGNGAYGIEAAARRYFSVSAKDLTTAQAATLVPLLKNPSGYDPFTYPDRALERRSIVVSRMVAAGHLTSAEAAAVDASPLGLKPSKPRHGCQASTYPFYCAQVEKLLRHDPAFGASAADRDKLLAVGGLTIRTALDPAAMDAATRAAKSTIPAGHSVATAVSVIEPGTGHVAAIATNRDFGSGAPSKTEIVLPAVSEFQPGSTFKMFTLATAFDQGFPLATRVPGGARYTSPVLQNPPKGYYSNSAGSSTNPTLTTATQMSMNTAFVQLEERVGVLNIAEMANRLGVKSVAFQGKGAPRSTDGSFTLGTANVSTVEMADAYATVAAGGRYCPPAFILAASDAAGAQLPVPGQGCAQVLDRAAADTVAHVLGTVVSQGTGRAASFGRPAAGKTGTTENLGAAWFAGFTPQYATAVWVGDPRGGAAHPLYNVLGYSRVYGGTLPATVWRKTMAALHKGLPVRPLPPPDPSYVATSAGKLLPSVVGLPLDAARNRVQVAGAQVVKVRQVRAKRGQTPGAVTVQSPGAGARAPGAKVTLTVAH